MGRKLTVLEIIKIAVNGSVIRSILYLAALLAGRNSFNAAIIRQSIRVAVSFLLN